MTAASIQARTGEIIGHFWWSTTNEYALNDYLYTGSPIGYSLVDATDGIAASWTGLTLSQFRGLTSGVRDRVRDAVRSRYSLQSLLVISGGRSFVKFASFNDLVATSSYISSTQSSRGGENGLTVTRTDPSVDAELLIGFIPEWGNGTSQSNIDAKDNAIRKMGWSHNRVVEWAKVIRRERNVSARSVFDRMIYHRDRGVSANGTIRKCLAGK